MKDAREVQVIVCQFQQFRHKTSSAAFIYRESTFIISCEKTSRKTNSTIDQLNNLQTVHKFL